MTSAPIDPLRAGRRSPIRAPTRPTLTGVDLAVDEGELCLVVGRTGSGKSTLLRAVNGLVPRFTGGLLTGSVSVGRAAHRGPPAPRPGRPGRRGRPGPGCRVRHRHGRGRAGLRHGEPRRGARRDASPGGGHARPARAARAAIPTARHLVGRQQQRVAIGAVLTASPRVLVLDEPTSALDPAAAEEVLAALTRLVHDLGITVLIAEHRLERVVQYADRIVHLPGGGRAGRDRRPGRRSWPRRRWRRRWWSWAGWPAGRRCRCRSATPAAPAGPLREQLRRRAGAARRGRRADATPVRPVGRRCWRRPRGCTRPTARWSPCAASTSRCAAARWWR